MKRLALFLFLSLAVLSGIQAQWVSKTYTLPPGWSSIWLSGDATYATVGNLFPSAITQVWRWNPNPDKIQFIQSPSDATAESEEWTVWKRDGSESKLSRIIGNSAYLVFNSASSNQTLSLTLFPRPPSNSWLISGANFMGFPALQNSKNFSQYFASFINSGMTGLPADTKVYKYIGGNLSSSNPALLSVAASSAELVAPNTAYWFSMPAVSDFSGPLSYEMASSDGLAYGRALTMLTLGIKNRTTASLTCNFALDSSATAPSGQPAITGPVALNIRRLNADGTSITVSAANQTVTIPANGMTNVDFLVDRSGMSATSSALYASILRVRDTSGFTDVQIPVTAQPADRAGLWFCQVEVNGVRSTVDSSTATAQSFPLNFLIHRSSDTTTLLRQAFAGKLASTGNPLGIATRESLVLATGVSDVDPSRFYSPIMPYNSNVINGTGSLASSVTWTIVHEANDPVNPFMHTYHPDHDNLNATFTAPASESYTVTRTCTFTIDNSQSTASSLVGSYTETITGLLKNSSQSPATLSVSGNFIMRRLSEISTLTTQ
jgi:hypothetical protein